MALGISRERRPWRPRSLQHLQGSGGLVVDSYRKAFFHSHPSCLLASARAGNVIGGGDWSDDRLLPDVARAYFSQAPLTIRAPHSVRPWQHVLESLHGYLLLAQQLMAGDTRCADAWNFGPAGEDSVPVLSLVQQVQKSWPELKIRVETVASDRHESNFLYLDATRARRLLRWRPIWNLPIALDKTTQWYEEVHKDSRRALQVTRRQIADFTADANRL
jgi:CDP-glucose 4,6-dehydratase